MVLISTCLELGGDAEGMEQTEGLQERPTQAAGQVQTHALKPGDLGLTPRLVTSHVCGFGQVANFSVPQFPNL